MYAGGVELKFKYTHKRSFWENARTFHKKIQPQYTNKNLFSDILNWLYLEPTIFEAMNFKKLGGLVPPDSTRYEKLSAFGRREDVVLRILQRDNLESLATPLNPHSFGETGNPAHSAGCTCVSKASTMWWPQVANDSGVNSIRKSTQTGLNHVQSGESRIRHFVPVRRRVAPQRGCSRARAPAHELALQVTVPEPHAFMSFSNS